CNNGSVSLCPRRHNHHHNNTTRGYFAVVDDSSTIADFFCRPTFKLKKCSDGTSRGEITMSPPRLRGPSTGGATPSRWTRPRPYQPGATAGATWALGRERPTGARR
ncbi:unnamed protein product, partial [Ectocarpus sp. 8 AP-2014]